MRKKVKELYALNSAEKTYPWKGASNVKLATILSACINMQARLFAALLGDKKPVKGFPIGEEKADRDRAERVERYMNYELLFGMPDFKKDMDATLMILPREGVAFKKTYYCSKFNRIVSTFVKPEDMVINYYVTSINDAYRVTQKINMLLSELKLKEKQGLFINTDQILYYESPRISEKTESDIENDRSNSQIEPTPDEATPRLILEQHTYYDYNGDGIEEPVVVTIDWSTKTLLRMASRENPDYPNPFDQYHTLNYYTAYTFLPNDSSIYGYGFGYLLYTITNIQNSALNQLIDSAHLANLRGGFINRRSGLTRGALSFKNGEFKEVDLRTDDISKSIMPLTFSPPSQVLLNLVTFLQSMAEKLTTVTDLFTGAIPRSDASATATVSAIEQGSKQVTGIQIRVYEAFREELTKIYLLESLYLDKTKFFNIVINRDKSMEEIVQTISVSKDDFKSPLDIQPVCDPLIVSQAERINKAQILLNTINSDPILQGSVQARLIALEEYFKALGIPEATISAIKNSYGESIQQMLQQAQQHYRLNAVLR